MQSFTKQIITGYNCNILHAQNATALQRNVFVTGMLLFLVKTKDDYHWPVSATA